MKLETSTVAYVSSSGGGLHSERRSQLAAGAGTATFTVSRALGAFGIALLALAMERLVVADLDWVVLTIGTLSLLVLSTAVLANVGTGKPPEKGSDGYRRWMIGVHLGLGWPPLVGVLYMTAAYLDATIGSWLDMAADFVGLACCGTALWLLLALRPRKAASTGLV